MHAAVARVDSDGPQGTEQRGRLGGARALPPLPHLGALLKEAQFTPHVIDIGTWPLAAISPARICI